MTFYKIIINLSIKFIVNYSFFSVYCINISITMTLTLQLFPYVPLVQCKESGFLSITESTWKSIKTNCYMWSVTLNSGCFTHMQQLSWKELFSLKKIEIIKIMFSREKFGITVTFKGHYNKNCFWIKNHCWIQLKTLKTKTAFIVWPWRLLPCWMLVIL